MLKIRRNDSKSHFNNETIVKDDVEELKINDDGISLLYSTPNTIFHAINLLIV